MRYRRALLLLELGQDARPSCALLQRMAPELQHLTIFVQPGGALAFFGSGHAPSPQAAIAELQAVAASTARELDVQLAPELPSEAVFGLCEARGIDLIVLATPSLHTAGLIAARKRAPVAMLWTRGVNASGPPIKRLGCVALDERSLRIMAAFLRDHGEASLQVTLLSRRRLADAELGAMLELSGIAAHVEAVTPSETALPRAWFERWTRERPQDMLVFAHASTALLLGSAVATPTLLLPTLTAAASAGRRALDISDATYGGHSLRARVEHATALGGVEPSPDQVLAIVSAGRALMTVRSDDSELILPASLAAGSIGVYRMDDAVRDPLAAIEQYVQIIRPEPTRLWLFDSQLRAARLRELRALAAAQGAELLAVRLRPTHTCRAIRERLRRSGLAARVIDARAVLCEGDAWDVAEPLDAVRLARVASRLQRAGYAVAGIVHRSAIAPSTHGFEARGERELSATHAASSNAPEAAPASTGNRIEIELDNARARGLLLDLIARSERSLHLQVYMALDDDIGKLVEAALVAAADRGVTVRVLVDSLHGLHGSFGTHNALLERLAVHPGIELRTWRPITELPSLADLKQRDHRKLAIADGSTALIGGRNLSHEYYTGFEEAQLTAASDWRVLPWLDAGMSIQGPAVAQLEASFQAAWVEVGGASFEIATPAPAGTCAARVVVHHGLRDANTLEAYLELIDHARECVYLVNGFPLALELQHALLRALRRGVRVHVLAGHVAPLHGSQPFAGSFATARTAATELVHSRLDPLVVAGASVYLFSLHDVPGWPEALGVVHPHVHAKLLSVDGERCALGSANFDITASYWESELLVVVEDNTSTHALEAQLERLLASSTILHKDDAGWQEHQKRRAWMRHWPGVLSV